MYMYMYICIYTHVYIYIYIHTYIHIHIHARMRAHRCRGVAVSASKGSVERFKRSASSNQGAEKPTPLETSKLSVGEEGLVEKSQLYPSFLRYYIILVYDVILYSIS